MVKDKNQRDKSPVTTDERLWLERELDLPPFLQTANTKPTKNIVATQSYVDKKSKKSNLLFTSIVLVDLILAYVLVSPMIDIDFGKKKSIPIAKIIVIPPGGFTESKTAPSAAVVESPTASVKVSTTPSTKAVPKVVNSAKLNQQTFVPQRFTSISNGQEITFYWKSPVNTKKVVGFELSVKKAGTQKWIVISSQTPEQLSVSVELISLTSSSDYRIGSVLENGKIVYNATILSLNGVM